MTDAKLDTRSLSAEEEAILDACFRGNIHDLGPAIVCYGRALFGQSESEAKATRDVNRLPKPTELALAEANVINRDLSASIAKWQEERNRSEREIELLRAQLERAQKAIDAYVVDEERLESEATALRARVAELEGMASEATLYLDGTHPAEAALELRIAGVLAPPIPLPEDPA